MRKKNYLISLLCIVCIILLQASSLAQESKIDSLKSLLPATKEENKASILDEIADNYLNDFNLDSSAFYAQKAGVLAQKTENYKELAVSLNYLGYTLYYQNLKDSALYYFTAAYDAADRVNFEKGKANNLAMISKLHYKTGRYELAKEKLLEAIKIDSTIENTRGIAISYNDLGALYKHIGDYKNSVKSYSKSLNKFEELGEINSIAAINGNISHVYLSWKDYPNALKYMRETENVFKNSGNKKSWANSINSIGTILKEQNKIDSALYYYKKALNIFTKIDSKFDIAVTKANIGLIYTSKEEYIKALESYSYSLKTFREGENISEINQTLFNIGNLEFLQKNNESAKKNLLEALSGAISKKDNQLVLQVTQLLSKIYAEIRNHKLAYKYQIQYTELNDSIFNADTHKQINEIQAKYETEKKNVEIKNLKIKSIEDESKQVRLQIIVGSISILSIVLIVFYILRMKTNRLLAEKNANLEALNSTQSKLMSIISHDFKAPLSAFYSITKSLKTKYDNIDRNEIENFLGRMLNSSVALKLQLENMLNWSMNQTRSITVNKKMTNLHIIALKTQMILEEFATEKSIVIHNKIDEEFEIETDGKLLAIVLNNLISNAVKFSDTKGEIILYGQRKNKKIILSVKDFGIGMTAHEAKKLFSTNIKRPNQESSETGLGLVVCIEIIAKLGGKIWAESAPKKGTEIFIELYA